MSGTVVELRPKVREFRIRRLLTQKQLADKSGVSISAISHIECGLTERIRPETWTALAAALDVEAADLVEVWERPLTPEEIAAQWQRVERRRSKEAKRQRDRRQRQKAETAAIAQLMAYREARDVS